VRGHDDFVALLHTRRSQRDNEPIRPICDSDGVLDAQESLDASLKFRAIILKDERAAFHHVDHRRERLAAVLIEQMRISEKRDLCQYRFRGRGHWKNVALGFLEIPR